MFTRGPEAMSLRLDQSELKRLAWALGISLAIHLLGYGTYELGKELHVWQRWHWPAWLQPPAHPAELVKARALDQTVPLMFVETTPSQATTEAPKDAKYYSDKNTRAANPDTRDNNQNVPKIEGTQDKVAKTEDTAREKFPLQPSRPAPVEKPAPPKPALTPGDLALAKPSDFQRQDTPRPEASRPRTLKEARARLQKIPGEKMKQAGGVRRPDLVPSFDTKATPFGAYDAAFIDAVTTHWYNLLDRRDFVQGRNGKVVLEFTLNYDGRITGMKMVENSAGEMLGLLCEKAVLDPAPFAPWPSDMRRMMGDTRNVRFTFYYY